MQRLFVLTVLEDDIERARDVTDREMRLVQLTGGVRVTAGRVFDLDGSAPSTLISFSTRGCTAAGIRARSSIASGSMLTAKLIRHLFQRPPLAGSLLNPAH